MAKKIVIDARIRRTSTGRYVDRLIEHLQKIDSENKYVVLIEPDDTWKPNAENFQLAYCPYPQFSINPLHQISFARQLYSLQADLVHFPMNQQPLFYFRPVVTSTLDTTMLRFTRAGRHSAIFHTIRMLAYRFLFWYGLRKSKAIITISEYVKNDIEKNYKFTRGNITVTYCATEPPSEVKSEKLKVDNLKQPFIMHVGSPFPHKNIERLVEAFTLLKKDKHSDLQLVLAGKKEYYFDQLIKDLENHEFRKDIIIPGFISDGELKWLYENTDCYVLPSLSEGFGLPGLEAMAHGAPVASSNATCLLEVFGDAASFFNPFDINHIAAVVSDIITSPNYANKLRTNGEARVICFSWEKMAKETLEVYSSILTGK